MIRHGQTEANKSMILSGHMDTQLTPLGREQAEMAQKTIELLDVKPDIIIHSHLSRARDTANIINQNLQLPTIEDSDYAEIHFGDWEGLPFTKTCNIQKSWENFGTAPNGESFEDFMGRIKRAKNRALALDAKKPLIVCHGGVFRALAKIYDHKISGVNNCHLHHFEPSQHNRVFPWSATSFEYNTDISGVVTQESECFHPK